ncbi:hypothetical protein Rhal01_00981 [Rubritalea halochordaticola]|uniref:Uncharacterized protein n=1 Tax=Rubritalea halochordaticola TaxID=714537 RepID=A0ABP9UWR9_9BACT
MKDILFSTRIMAVMSIFCLSYSVQAQDLIKNIAKDSNALMPNQEQLESVSKYQQYVNEVLIPRIGLKTKKLKVGDRAFSITHGGDKEIRIVVCSDWTLEEKLKFFRAIVIDFQHTNVSRLSFKFYKDQEWRASPEGYRTLTPIGFSFILEYRK